VFKSFSDTFDYISARRRVLRAIRARVGVAPQNPDATPARVAWSGFRVTRRRVMTRAQLADTLAGCVNQQINQEQPGSITGVRDHLRGRQHHVVQGIHEIV
jgi:hypothetical protein